MGQGYRSYKLKGVKNQSRYYFFLSIILIAIIVKWGVPAFVSMVAGTGKDNANITTQDNIPPQKPVLASLPEATNSATIEVSGYSSAQAEMKLFIDSTQRDTMMASDNGDFRFVTELTKGEHLIKVIAGNSSGKTAESDTKTVIFDNQPLTIDIAEPKDGASIVGIKNKSLPVKGKLNKADATLKIGGNFVNVGQDGIFSGIYVLSEGNNEIGINGIDPAGNSVEVKLKVNFSL